MAINVGQAATAEVNNLRGFKNQIINGDTSVWQQGPGPFTLWEYTADQIKQQAGNTSNRSSDAPSGFGYSIDLTATTPALNCVMELPVTGSAGQYSIGSRWILSAFAKPTVTTTVGFGLNFSDTPGSATNRVLHTVNQTATAAPAGVWTRVYGSCVITAPPNGTNTCCNMFVSAPASGSCKFTGFQLELAAPNQNEPTAYEHIDPATQLSRCQRYFRSTVNSLPVGRQEVHVGASGPGIKIVTNTFPDMRAIPTIQIYDAAGNPGRLSYATSVWSSALTHNLVAGAVANIYPGGFNINSSNTVTCTGFAYTYTADSRL